MKSTRLLQIGYNNISKQCVRAFSQCSSSSAGVTVYHTRVLSHQTRPTPHRLSPARCSPTQPLGILPVQNLLQQYSQVRWQSGDAVNAAGATGSTAGSVADGAASTLPLPDGYIPQPPSLEGMEQVADPVLVMNHLGEATFASLGLNNYTPVGFVQAFLETLHVSLDLPWVPAIALATVAMRSLVFPLFVQAQKALAQQANLQPTYMALVTRLNEAKSRRDIVELSRVSRQFSDFMEKNDYNPRRALLAPLSNAPIFMSFIIALRQVSIHVPALQNGGMLWFQDLAAYDPYFVLPVLNALAMSLTIEMGTDAQRAKNMTPLVKWCLRCVPLTVFTFTLKFPAVMCLYWLINSMWSLVQAAVLRQTRVRTFFNIPELVDHSKAEKYGVKMGTKKDPNPLKSTMDAFKETRAASKKLKELEERDRVAEKEWRKAGSQPIMKTYKHDPTKSKKARA